MKSFIDFLTESKYKKGDSVKVKNVKKYDSASKSSEVTGTVMGMMNSTTVMVKVGSGQMNVDVADILKEHLTEANKVEVSVRDARTANDIAKDMFRGEYKNDGSNVFVFKKKQAMQDFIDELESKGLEVMEEAVAKMSEREAKQILKLSAAMDKPSSPAMASSMKKDIQNITSKYGKKLAELVKQAESIVSESVIEESEDVMYRNITELMRDFKFLTRKSKNAATINKPQENSTKLMDALSGKAGFKPGAKFSQGSKKFLNFVNRDVTIQFQHNLDDPNFGQIVISISK